MWKLEGEEEGADEPDLFLGGLKVRVGAGRVVRDVHDATNLRHMLAQQTLDSLTQRHVRHAASLASAAHAEQYDGILYVNQLDVPTMAANHRVDVRFEQLRHAVIERVVTQCRAHRPTRHGRRRPLEDAA